MKITDLHIMRGPNYWSVNHRLVVMRLDIGKFEELPTNRIDGFYDRIRKLLPGLYQHYCSEGKPGGLFERIKSGRWIGHIVEHIALELQLMAGMKCSFGKTRGTGQKGIYDVVFEYEEERVGLFAAQAAVKIAEALCIGDVYNIHSEIEQLKKIYDEDRLGPSTASIVNAATLRNIPFIRLDNDSLVQLGYGSKQKIIQATTTESTSIIAVDLAADKFRSKQILRRAGIPVPDGRLISSPEEIHDVIREIGFPLAIKPYNRNQGFGVTLNIQNLEDAINACKKAGEFSSGILVEKYFTGNDFRLLVINYKMVAAAQRTPAMVTGDSISTIRELVDMANRNPSRGIDHENILTRIRLDDSTEELLKSQRITLNDILPQGKQVFLKQTANLSTGGTSEDVTDLIHPEIIALAERVARITGLDICGIDFIAEDITRSVKRSNGVVIEVNAAPGFRMHTNPFKGKPRPVGEAVVNMLFPEETNGRIPIIAITGTNGKTTTTRIIAHIVKTAGYTVGSTTTDGIYIDGNLIEAGDCTGPSSTAKVLSDKTVDFAVLECARGGILRSGLGYDYCDIGVVTNVADDHIGIDGINSVQEMALVKSVVPETIGKNGYAVLNENNEFTLAMAERIKCNVALFSINHRSKKIVEHCKRGGIACIFKEGKIYLLHGQNTVLYEMAENIPITFGGKAVFMIENVMAAILAAYTKNIPVNVISSALHSFIPTYETTPGRMNLYHFKNFSFMLDYAHNLHGMNAIGSYIKQTKASPKVGIITAPGDRRNEDIFNVGRAAAEIFDRIIIRIDEDTRGRKLTEIVDLLYNGIRSKNRNMNVEIIAKEAEALNYALSNASEGSLIVLFSEDIAKANELLMDFKHREDEFIYTDATEPDYVLRVGKNNLFEYTRKKSFSNRR